MIDIKAISALLTGEVRPPPESVYMNPIDFDKLIHGWLIDFAVFDPDHPDKLAASYNGFTIYSDTDVTPGRFYIAPPEAWDIFKRLKAHPLLHEGLSDDDLMKIANSMYISRRSMDMLSIYRCEPKKQK
jgi:hypothetical protein